MCDKQISANTSRAAIYCSDACRQADESHPAPLLSRLSTSSATMLNGYHGYDDLEDRPPPNIVTPASPTARTFPSPPLNPQMAHEGTPPSDVNSVLANGTGPGSSAFSPPSSYAMTMRPLPPRQNPASFSGSPRSIELVTPFMYHNGGVTGPSMPGPGSLNDAVRWSAEEAQKNVYENGMMGGNRAALVSRHSFVGFVNRPGSGGNAGAAPAASGGGRNAGSSSRV
ncbi:MAG: hypothetical protein M1823_001691 [Watsoniomyces obsoletus]|nr:MAG: hypothetical protein M1823_001691 [Watsoniomyces obsoletus]